MHTSQQLLSAAGCTPNAEQSQGHRSVDQSTIYNKVHTHIQSLFAHTFLPFIITYTMVHGWMKDGRLSVQLSCILGYMDVPWVVVNFKKMICKRVHHN